MNLQGLCIKMVDATGRMTSVELTESPPTWSDRDDYPLLLAAEKASNANAPIIRTSIALSIQDAKLLGQWLLDAVSEQELEANARRTRVAASGTLALM